MPCQGCVGWMGQQTGTYTKYWCPADSSFHFDWEPCGAPAPPPPAAPPPSGSGAPPLTGGGTPAAVTGPITTMAPLGGISKGCKCCGPSAVTPNASASMALVPGVATAVMPCECQHKRAIPWWVWVLGALGAISVLRRVARG